MNELTKLILEDMKPSLGVTEPGAIALATAKAREYVRGELCSIHVALNSGMYKNAFTCGIPKTDQVGAAYAAALGYLIGDASLGLEVLAGIDEKAQAEAEQLLAAGKVTVSMTEITSEIFIRANVKTTEGSAAVTITHAHTNISNIEADGKTIFAAEKAEEEENEAPARIHSFSMREIYDYVNQVEIEELEPVKAAFAMNLELLETGLESKKTVIAHQLKAENQGECLSDDVLLSAQLLSAGAIEARVLGIGKPAMSITGSGSHGIIAVMPLYGYAKIKGISEEKLLRAAALSMLITQYIKEYSGKLSAMCGCGVAAGSGMACALTYLAGGDYDRICQTLNIMSLGITGMICDGGNHGCALKTMTAVDAAFRAKKLAMSGICIDPAHGICGDSPEKTMRYIGHVSVPGMTGTEAAILDIFKEK